MQSYVVFYAATIEYYIAMARSLNITYPTVLVLRAIERGYCYGFDIMDVTGLPSGTVYPALRRLEQHSLLRSRWEDERKAAAEQRPPRRYYVLTRAGKDLLAEGLARFPGLERVIPAAGAETARP